METALTSHTPVPARAPVWIGRTLTGLITAFLLVDAAAKLVPLSVVVEATQKAGFGPELVRPLGVLLAACTVLHLVPRTQFLGALLLTAYLGGATATHVRLGTPFWFPVVMGAILWGAYALRNPELRSFLRAQAR